VLPRRDFAPPRPAEVFLEPVLLELARPDDVLLVSVLVPLRVPVAVPPRAPTPEPLRAEPPPWPVRPADPLFGRAAPLGARVAMFHTVTKRSPNSQQRCRSVALGPTYGAMVAVDQRRAAT